eukprot:14423935-Ditylum_brightwellii.AAC.1
MVRFSGWSMETHRIKDKPIGKGCKLFNFFTTAGYVFNFTPDVRIAAKSQQQEYKTKLRNVSFKSTWSTVKERNDDRQPVHAP